MDIFLLILRLVLAGVFGLAAISKAFDMQGSVKAFADFGVPTGFRKPLAYILPALEFAVAVALLFTKISWYGGLGANALLLIFVAGMLYQFAKGNAPDCHCFGQIHSEPVGVSSIVRNIALLIPAGILSVQGRAEQGLSISSTPQEVLTLSIGVTVVSLVLIAILYLRSLTEQHAKILRRLEVMDLIEKGSTTVERDAIGHPREGLPFGALVPEFAAKDLDGKTVTLREIKSYGLPVLFLFVSPTCTPCKAMGPEIDEWEAEFKDRVKFVFVTELTAEENRAKFAHVPGRTILLQDDKERAIASIFRAKWTPMAVLMNRKGRIASFTSAGDASLRELVAKIQDGDPQDDYAFFKSRDTMTLAKIRIGEELPHFHATDITGVPVDSHQLAGKKWLLTFWSDTCRYCGPMMEEMKAWESKKNGSGPEMLVFADGDREAHKELGLQARVIHDEENLIGTSIGQYGTPSAIMVDENGRYITETAVGAEDIWSLVGETSKTDG